MDVNLTKDVENGKLDPVIGRDDEIVVSFKSCHVKQKIIQF